jgi:hypothetical protein
MGRALLSDVRQIGPISERDISGVCSACGVTLLARLDDYEAEKPTPVRLRAMLERVFERHVADKHPNEANASSASSQGNITAEQPEATKHTNTT